MARWDGLAPSEAVAEAWRRGLLGGGPDPASGSRALRGSDPRGVRTRTSKPPPGEQHAHRVGQGARHGESPSGPSSESPGPLLIVFDHYDLSGEFEAVWALHADAVASAPEHGETGRNRAMTDPTRCSRYAHQRNVSVLMGDRKRTNQSVTWLLCVGAPTDYTTDEACSTRPFWRRPERARFRLMTFHPERWGIADTGRSVPGCCCLTKERTSAWRGREKVRCPLNPVCGGRSHGGHCPRRIIVPNPL